MIDYSIFLLHLDDFSNTQDIELQTKYGFSFGNKVQPSSTGSAGSIISRKISRDAQQTDSKGANLTGTRQGVETNTRGHSGGSAHGSQGSHGTHGNHGRQRHDP